MANRHEKMDAADRAKQFMPFDALKGFREALEAKERMQEQEQREHGMEQEQEQREHGMEQE